jgi:hypothetical protein
MQRFRSLVICSGRRAEEEQHRGYGKSPTEVHLAKIRLQLERMLHVQVLKRLRTHHSHSSYEVKWREENSSFN